MFTTNLVSVRPYFPFRLSGQPNVENGFKDLGTAVRFCDFTFFTRINCYKS
jgi:hypothetical protein